LLHAFITTHRSEILRFRVVQRFFQTVLGLLGSNCEGKSIFKGFALVKVRKLKEAVRISTLLGNTLEWQITIVFFIPETLNSE